MNPVKTVPLSLSGSMSVHMCRLYLAHFSLHVCTVIWFACKQTVSISCGAGQKSVCGIPAARSSLIVFELHSCPLLTDWDTWASHRRTFRMVRCSVCVSECGKSVKCVVWSFLPHCVKLLTFKTKLITGVGRSHSCRQTAAKREQRIVGQGQRHRNRVKKSISVFQ